MAAIRRSTCSVTDTGVDRATGRLGRVGMSEGNRKADFEAEEHYNQLKKSEGCTGTMVSSKAREDAAGDE